MKAFHVSEFIQNLRMALIFDKVGLVVGRKVSISKVGEWEIMGLSRWPGR
jgi:hypothetical protein